jgi:hypothetical protein
VFPRNGGRAVLELDGETDAEVRYRASLYTPDQQWTGAASIAPATGELTWTPWQGAGEPPPWLVKYAATFLRSAWRERQKDVPYPRRLNRWRQERE